MQGIDETFSRLVEANPQLRPRVGNPDEMRSNRLIRTLELLKFRVTDPEAGIPESVHGAVITALNEEAVVSAALANKAGINLVHTYEAFGPKMLGAVRQELIFAQNCAAAGRPQNWLSVPVIMTSHTWENGKNEHSHQDPAFAEVMMGEAWPFSRVVFPPDYNTAAVVTAALYETRAQIWTIVAPKADCIRDLFSPAEASAMLGNGALALDWAGHQTGEAKLLLAAAGAYQLEAVLAASQRLRQRGVAHRCAYLLEPARLDQTNWRSLLPGEAAAAVVVSHTRPHVLQGLLSPLHPAGAALEVLGYRNRGGTLDTAGMMMVNGCSWAHVISSVALALGIPLPELLEANEREALAGKRNPQGVLVPMP